MLGKKESKSDGDCVENTDFAYAATSRPGHMPRQLPARLSGIRSIWVKVRHRPYSFETGPVVYPANAFDSRLRGD